MRGAGNTRTPMLIVAAAINGTRAGVVTLTPDGITVSTRTGETHYMHVLDYVSDCVNLPVLTDDLTRGTLVRHASPIKLTRKAAKLMLKIPPEDRDAINSGQVGGLVRILISKAERCYNVSGLDI